MSRLLWVAAILAGSCSQPIEIGNCRTNAECQAGHACRPDGICVQADPLEVVAQVLPPAYLHEVYLGAAFQARGGVPPYRWRFEARTAGVLDWLAMNADTGELRSVGDESPWQTGAFQLEVYVRDQSNYGQGQEASRLLTIYINDGRCDPNPCPDGTLCCQGSCVDVTSSYAHCGSCGISCDSVRNAEGGRCQAGACTYDACASQYHDCDQDPATGCETPSNLSNCGGCGDDCTDVKVYVATRNPTCFNRACVFDCEPGFADCDSEVGNGCEAGLSTVNNCGECGSNCAEAPAGSVCLEAGQGQWGCGCRDLANCPADSLCCGQMCTAKGPAHCGECGRVCAPDLGGPVCNSVRDFLCTCDSDRDCFGQVAGFAARCDQNFDTCACGAGPGCAGSPQDACCDDGQVVECKDLTSDVDHCGACNSACAAGMQCVAGVCQCDGGHACPAGSSAPDCQGSECVCQAFGQQACPPGQFCCSNGGAQGCCLTPCDSSGERDVCSASCSAPRVWCAGGCCASCDPADAHTCVR